MDTKNAKLKNIKTSKDLDNVLAEIDTLQDLEKAKILQRFFKTKTGEYGEGDIFIGISMPEQRVIARKYMFVTFDDISYLLRSEIHEHRMIGLLILTFKFEELNKKSIYKVSNNEKLSNDKLNAIYDFLLRNISSLNNWDLVDVIVPKIIGEYIYQNPSENFLLYEFANSSNLWKKRISIISTLTFIKNGKYDDTIKISEILLNDSHDLIHKAVGWMLREVGKKNKDELVKFLDKYSKTMPRTMLRYSLEKMDDNERKHYMKK